MYSDVLCEDFEYLYTRNVDWEKLNNKTVLVTGGTGLIGSLLLKYMDFLNKEKEFSISLIASIRDEAKAETFLKDLCVEVVKADLTDSFAVAKHIDYIFHCAAITKSKEMVEHPVEVLESIVNVTGTILRFAAENKVESMVYLSSMEVYGQPYIADNLVTEEVMGYIDPLNSRSCYPLGKRMAENLCYDYYKEYQVPVKIARLAQVFGAGILPGENRVFAQFAKSAINGNDIVLHTDGTSVGNYCYTADMLFGLFLLLLDGENGEAYNISNEDNNMSIKQMAQLVATQIANDEIEVVFDIPEENTFGYAPKVNMKLCSDKIRLLGWEAEFDMVQMYQRMIRDMKKSDK